MQQIINKGALTAHRSTGQRCFFLIGLGFLLLITRPISLEAGPYMDSAHGAADIGVYRSKIGDAPPDGFGYSRGNCAHCHEQHASIVGSEPDPVTGPSSFTLFATNFNTGNTTGPYIESDNFCFYCHNTSGSAQVVNINKDYSETFGCAGAGQASILTTMSAGSQLSSHNLYDIATFTNGQFPWFKSESNPCNGCHNPHLAKRNRTSPTDPTFSAISKPSDHFSLWGTTETMGSSYNTAYEPPFCSNNLTDREPASSGDAASGRASTPDYVSFCTDCHNATNTIYSTNLGANLSTIDWANDDSHGSINARSGVALRAPYATAGNVVLSCLDCHEPHGAPNIMLLRRRVNGSDLIDGTITGSITTLASNQWGYLCRKCHPDDDDPLATSGTGDPNKWQYIHHLATDAPIPSPKKCSACHGMGQSPINCGTTGIVAYQCHGHGKSF